MGRLFTSFKACQNCRYWTGSRKIDGFAKITESIDDKGKCINRNSFFNLEMNKGASCKHFEPIV